MVIVDPENAAKVRRIFELYAHHNLTLDSLIERLFTEGIYYRSSAPKFPRSQLYRILTDRSYIGELKHRDNWYPGKHEPLVDRTTWDRVQALLGGRVYPSHELTYAGDLIQCGHCDHPLTGEQKTKQTKQGEREYTYYRCSKYNTTNHPRTRLTERELDCQVLALFDRMRIENADVREWFVKVLLARAREDQEQSRQQRASLYRLLTQEITKQERLLECRLGGEIDAETYAGKQTELRDRAAKLKLQIDILDRGHDENVDIAVRAFELSQSLREKWLTADFTTKRRILEILWLNCRLENATLRPTMRKPFDVLAEGLVSAESRGNGI